MSRKQIPEIKLILLGESGVGKTSIIKRYIDDTFSSNVTSTLAMSYIDKIMEINNKKIKLNIWDTIGQEKYRALSKLFLNETKIAVLVYSITSMETFKNLDYWYSLYKEIGEDTILGIAGNKMDLFLEQEVSEDIAREYAKKCGAIFSLVSARDNKQSIDFFIEKLVKAYLKKKSGKNEIDKKDNENNTIKLDEKKHDKNFDNSSDDDCCLGRKKLFKKKNDISTQKEEDNIINSIFLGENEVGKTSLINRITGKEFNKNEKHTDKIKESLIDYKNNSKDLKLRIYDIDNEKQKTKEVSDIILNSKIFFLVYNIKNKDSLEQLGTWVKNIRKIKDENKNNDNYLLFIIGNKQEKTSLDKDEEGIIINQEDKKEYIEEGKVIASNNKGIFRATSAMDNTGLNDIVGEAIENYLNLSYIGD